MITPMLTCNSYRDKKHVLWWRSCIWTPTLWSENCLAMESKLCLRSLCVLKLLLFWNHCRCSILVSCLKQLAGLQRPCKGQQHSCTVWVELSPRRGSKVALGTFWEERSHFIWRKFKTLSSKCWMNYKVSKTVQSKNRGNASAGQTKLDCKPWNILNSTRFSVLI